MSWGGVVTELGGGVNTPLGGGVKISLHANVKAIIMITGNAIKLRRASTLVWLKVNLYSLHTGSCCRDVLSSYPPPEIQHYFKWKPENAKWWWCVPFTKSYCLVSWTGSIYHTFTNVITNSATWDKCLNKIIKKKNSTKKWRMKWEFTHFY